MTLADAKILVVEDEPMIAALLEDMLQELGCATVWTRSTVADALAFLGQHSPDIAVLDLHLYGDLAFPVADRLKQQQIPFIFSTGHPPSELGARLSSEICISMPYTIEVLEDALNAALRSERHPSGAGAAS